MRIPWTGLLLMGFPTLSLAADVPSPIGNNSMMAASPMTDYTVAAVVYVLLIGFLIAGLLIGGMLLLNLGLLSKRDRDRTGGRNPSDVGILKHSNWPQVPEFGKHLPAEDWDEEQEALAGPAAGTQNPPSDVPTDSPTGLLDEPPQKKIA